MCIFQDVPLTHQSLEPVSTILVIESVQVFLPHLIDNNSNYKAWTVNVL